MLAGKELSKIARMFKFARLKTAFK